MSIDLQGHQNFVAVIAIQFLWFAFITLTCGSLSAAPRRLMIGALVGLPVGLAFDLVIGWAGSIFHYAGLELKGPFLLLNSLLSYGLAIATVLMMNVGCISPYVGRHRRLAFAFACLALALLSLPLLLLPVDARSPILAMLLIGASVLAVSEVVALVLGRTGYLLQFAEGRWNPALQVWLFAIATGVVYETANHFFPLWVWVNQSPTPAANMFLIVVFGYFVLFLPIFSLVGIVRSYRGKSSLADSVI